MKPEQFIREFGEKKARDVIEGAPKGATYYELTIDGDFYFKQERFNWFCFGGGELIKTYMDEYETFHLIPLSCLKRLVESLEIINDAGGIEQAKKRLDGYISFAYGLIATEQSLNPYTGHIKKMQKAIAVHESIYGGGDE